MPTTLTSFTPGDIVISVYGNGDGSNPNYTLDQAGAITLYELTTTGSLVGQLVLPETTTTVNGVTNYAISGEYGSASEGALSLSADGQSLAIFGYGVNNVAFNTAGATGGSNAYGNAALGQSTSVKGGTYTAVARVVADINASAKIDTSTAIYNIYNTNNPRTVATVNGTTFYLSGQSVKGSTTQGVFVANDGTSTATAIDTSTDTREAEIVNGVLYVSRDSTQNTTSGTDIGSYGGLPTSPTAQTPLVGITESVTLTAGQANSVNASLVGTSVNLSPQAFYFANATTLYVADSGAPKNGGTGDGGLQKWSLVSGKWVLDYTLSTGLNLVTNTTSAGAINTGTTGLYALTGVTNGGTVTLYATTSTAGELDTSYLYSINDSLAATTLPTAESFTQLMSAASDTIIRGVAFAPTAVSASTTPIIVSGGVTSAGLTVYSGSTVSVLSGGTLTGGTVLSGGTAIISGGVDTGDFIANGGMETVLSGTVGNGQVNGSQTIAGPLATLSNEAVGNGGVVTLAAAASVTASGLTVTTGGTVIVGSGDAISNTVINGGSVVLSGATAAATGTLTFSGGGTLQETTALPSTGFGDQAVIAGFGSGAIVDIAPLAFSGATLSTAVVSGNTVATVKNGAVSATFTFAGSVAANLGIAADTLASPGTEIVFVPPPTSNTVVSSGALPSSGLVVGSGSTLTVNGGGTVVSATILSGGMETLGGTETGTVISFGGNETVSGTATADSIYGIQLVSASAAIVNNETVFNGGALDLFLKGGVANNTVVSSGGTFAVSGFAVGSNTTLAGGATVSLQSPKATLTGNVVFQGTGDTLAITGLTSAGFGLSATSAGANVAPALISGFVNTDIIDIAAFGPGATLTSALVSGNTVVTVSSGTTATQNTQSFVFAGAYTSNYFSLTPDEGTGVQINAAGTPCYCPGTRIMTPEGETPVETLAIGDLITTASGQQRPIKWIGRRAYAGRFATGKKHILPVRFAAGALGNGLPKRDLVVSPLHAMFIDDVLIPAASLVNGRSITQPNQVDLVEYIHIELDTHDVILAEGAPSETFVDDGSRGMFHNAADFARLYPDAGKQPARYCAPRLEDGMEVEAVRRRLVALAQSPAPISAVPADGLEFHLDEASRGRIRGWARARSTPNAAVPLQIEVDGQVLCEVLADTFRADLLAAGIGHGRHAFDVAIPGGLSPDAAHVITIRHRDDGSELHQRLCA